MRHARNAPLHSGRPRAGGGSHRRPGLMPGVYLIEGAARGLEPEHPEANEAEDVPRGEIDEGRAEHREVRRRRLDEVAGAHDYRQPERPDELAAIAHAIAQAHTAGAQPGQPDLRHVWTVDRVDGTAELS